jgi:hypothetical protein
MEVYILDSLYRRSAVVDRFESLIWTERWAEVGDFELHLSSTPVNRSIFTPNTKLALNESKRVMVVETIEDYIDSDNRTLLKVVGRSIEKILEDRVTSTSGAVAQGMPAITYSTMPSNVAYNMFAVAFIYGTYNANDKILNISSTPREGTNPFYNNIIDWRQKPATVLDGVRDVCNAYDMGFRLVRNGETGQLLFTIYSGNNRTTEQQTLTPVVFSPGLETVQNTHRLMTIKQEKNVAYVFNEQGNVIVYANPNDPVPSGMDRRVLLVNPPKLVVQDGNGNNVDPTPTEISNYLIQKGTEDLATHTSLLAFDGEISQRSPYRYGVHYDLGDLVNMRDADGVGNRMRVTEQVFAHDQEGERSYPTLSIDEFVVPGAWSSYLGNRYWSDFGATEYWNTQP